MMKKLLGDLLEIPAVDGAMVMTDDGILVRSVLSESLDENSVAALSSGILTTIVRFLKTGSEMTRIEEAVLSASKGKLVFVDLGKSFLVAVTRPNLRLSTDLVEIRSVARRLRKVCEFNPGNQTGIVSH